VNKRWLTSDDICEYLNISKKNITPKGDF
jgi:hypothetical protein